MPGSMPNGPPEVKKYAMKAKRKAEMDLLPSVSLAVAAGGESKGTGLHQREVCKQLCTTPQLWGGGA